MVTPTRDYRRTDVAIPTKLVKGVDTLTEKLVGRYKRRSKIIPELIEEAEIIDKLDESYRHVSDRKLRDKLQECRDLFRRGGELENEVVYHSLAAIREASARQLGLRPFVVQLAGALALYRGFLAEMATGEGKTLTAGVAAVLNGWTGFPCHIVTHNDYLAERDADWIKPLYRYCGVSVGHVVGQQEEPDRRAGYEADVTYTTSKELTADFLRDRLRLGDYQNGMRRQIKYLLQKNLAQQAGLVLRGVHTCIVDEADSLMIDEAVTPLIISRQHGNQIFTEACRAARDVADKLEMDVHYTLNWRYREIELKEDYKEQVQKACAHLGGLWRSPDRREELIKQALTAKELYHLEKNYVIDGDGKVVIVDESTGRMMPMRTWQAGLHQAIEAKEGLEITNPTETTARLSFQRFFRFFKKLSGMTGTAKEAADEFWHVYKLPVVTMPTNRPCIRSYAPDRIFADEAAKWDGIVKEVVLMHFTGRPILVGTRSIRASEELARRLEDVGLSYNLLNATRHGEEAQIVAEAGQMGKVTVATNMAGRGTDIKLGRGVADIGGLHVISSERHESGRIDRQLFGRSARQGDPGSAQAFVCMEDELIKRFVPEYIRKNTTASLRKGQSGAEANAGALVSRAQHNAQKLASRQRVNVLKTDTWLEEALSFTGADRSN